MKRKKERHKIQREVIQMSRVERGKWLIWGKILSQVGQQTMIHPVRLSGRKKQIKEEKSAVTVCGSETCHPYKLKGC